MCNGLSFLFLALEGTSVTVADATLFIVTYKYWCLWRLLGSFCHPPAPHLFIGVIPSPYYICSSASCHFYLFPNASYYSERHAIRMGRLVSELFSYDILPGPMLIKIGCCDYAICWYYSDLIGTTNFHLPQNATVHGIIIRQPAATTNNVRTEERVYIHYDCKTKQNCSTLSAFIRPACLQFTPPGLPEGGQTLEYVWHLPTVGTVVRTQVEVWICGATCTLRYVFTTLQRIPLIMLSCR